MSLEQVIDILRGELALRPKHPAVGRALAEPDQWERITREYDASFDNWQTMVREAVESIVAEHDRSTS